ncbi:MAG: AAA family ATPase [Hamadaea sp.]|uniref:ATP-binding protein n=1 Tax=Hamadaea sp. TaxID=2024425 RepID=UPI0017F280B1|nr:BTAD domain-containing putative transcriptional regulator [Hamadaea sp.]NUT18366.1 AAA family ATPase [Hamadaea sp.]
MTPSPSVTPLFSILGAVEIRQLDGTGVAISGAKRQAILALLLLEADRTVSTDRLIEGLYADGPLADAANALHGQVSRLRRLVRGTGAVIESGPAGYRLDADPESVDAHLFSRLAADGRRLLTADPAAAEELLSRALELWRGRAVPDLPDIAFLHPHVTRLVQLRLAAIEDHAEAALARDDHVAVVAELSELLREHPLRERACALLMRALYRSGRQAEALELYERTRRLLASDLGADPSAELAAAHLAILRDRPSPGPRRPPAQLTSFIGREEDLAQLVELLGRERLITVIGPGGTGKTRLAIEAAATLPGEVAFIELARLSDARLLGQTISAALGLNEPGLLSTAGPPAAEAHLVAALADRPLLIILDNCEHIVDDTARLAYRLLAACPQLRILATSRESLGVTGETLFPLRRLGVAAADSSLSEQIDSPAVRLFADRARTVRRDFRVDETEIDHVVRICAELDGLPLAIELAAARLRSLTPAEIAAGLSDRFRLLSRGSRAAEPRHQSLRAVAEWSWELLDPAERTLARRLTAFAGGATVASATAVCGLPAADVPDLLAGLVEKSFVDYSGGRYRMLQTIRAFCAERLAEAGEESRVRRAHAEYFAQLTVTADAYLRGSEQLAWLDRLTAENDDLRTALRWTAADDPGQALRMAAAMSWYWYQGGLRHEGAVLCAELLTRIGDTPPDDLAEEYALCASNAMATPSADLAASRRLAYATRMIADRPPRWPATAVLCRDIDRPPATDDWSQATAELFRGDRHIVRGETELAEAALVRALDGFRAVGERWGATNALDSLAELAAWRGNWPATLSLMSSAIDTVAQTPTATATLTDLLCRRAKVHTLTGDLDAARADLARAAQTAARAGHRDVPELHQGLGDVARSQGDLAEAAAQYATALATASPDADSRFLRLKALRGLGWIAVAAGQADEAVGHYRALLDEALEHHNYLLAADAVNGLAAVAQLNGDGVRAALLLGAGRAVHPGRRTEDQDTRRVLSATQQQIGPEAFAEALAAGQAMSREEALQAARAATT